MRTDRDEALDGRQLGRARVVLAVGRDLPSISAGRARAPTNLLDVVTRVILLGVRLAARLPLGAERSELLAVRDLRV